MLSRERLPKIGLWIATVYAVFFALILLLESIDPDPYAEEGQEWEGFAVGILAVVALAAIAVAWRRRHLALPALLATGLLGAFVALITAGSNQWLAVIVAGGPYLLGALFIWWGGIGRPSGTA